MTREMLEVIEKQIDSVLGYGGAWDAHSYLSKLHKQIKELLEESK
jgi:hypothetical protein